MAVTVGAITNNSGTTSGGTTKTYAHNNDGDFLLVAVAPLVSANANPTGVTYNGVNMTLVDEVAYSLSVGVSLWRLVAPAAGSNNVVITFGNTDQYHVSAAVSFSGVDQTTPLGTPTTATSTGTTAPSVTVSGATGDLIVDCHGIFQASGTATTVTVGASQTSRVEGTLSGVTARRLCMSTEDGAASVVMDWSLSQSCRTRSVGVAIQPAGGGSTDVLIQGIQNLEQQFGTQTAARFGGLLQ